MDPNPKPQPQTQCAGKLLTEGLRGAACHYPQQVTQKNQVAPAARWDPRCALHSAGCNGRRSVTARQPLPAFTDMWRSVEFLTKRRCRAATHIARNPYFVEGATMSRSATEEQGVGMNQSREEAEPCPCPMLARCLPNGVPMHLPQEQGSTCAWPPWQHLPAILQQSRQRASVSMARRH